MPRMAKVSFQLLLSALLFVPLAAFAQTQDPLIGSWNESGANTDGSAPFIAIMNFNAGGTTMETDTAGTNSSASPGESVNLGTWIKTSTGKYTFRDRNYIYNSSGNLSHININVCKITLGATLKTFTGTCVFRFYTCSVATCPGTFVAQFNGNLAGRRF